MKQGVVITDTSSENTQLKEILVLILSLLLVISSVGFGAGMVAGMPTNAETNGSETDTIVESAVSDAGGNVEVLVRFDATDRTVVQSGGADALKTHANTSQTALERLAEHEDGITIEQQFWLANAALVTVDTDSADLRSIAALENVTAIQENVQLELPETEPGDDDRLVTSANAQSTTGLEQIDAPAVWEEFDTRGENVTVAVLDSGIDVDHPDLELVTTNESDPTYPGGWAEFDSAGNKLENTEPYESDTDINHGTHVSGTVAGGNASGTYVGVAPEADLMHGLVLPDGTGSAPQTIAGMEWAIENDADVIVTSLSTVRKESFMEPFIEPVQNARDAGVAVVAASGNQGVETSGSPANVYESVSVGAVDDSGNVESNSSGQVVDTETAWSDPPESWPDQYTVPDVAAPGVNVESTLADGEYGTITGTSMAAPHVAGIHALALANDDDLTNAEIQHALEATASHPTGEGVDSRYGHGIVNAKDTVTALAEGGVTGTVTDPTGTPVANATVTLDTDLETTTDDDGTYDLAAVNGTYNATVGAIGYKNVSTTVTVDGGETTADFTLEPALVGTVAADQPALIEAGETITVDLAVTNAETLVVESGPDTELGGNETLTVNGEPADIGAEIPLAAAQKNVTISLETTDETPDSVALQHTLAGHGEETTITTGPTTVLERFVQVGVIDDDGTHGDAIADVLEGDLEGGEISIEHSDAILEAETPPHDVYVVQTLSEANAAAFVEATNSSDVGAVYLDQWGDDANGIQRYASVTGDPTEFGEGDTLENDTAEPPVQYIAETEHPILSNRTTGDEFPIHYSDFVDHSWFEGTDFDVIASVSHGGSTEPAGPALAVDDDSNTVLASSLARTTFLGTEEFTDAANATLVGSTTYVVPTDDETDETDDEAAVQIGTTETFVDYSSTVTVNTTADDVAGYQLALEFDPEVVHITDVDGGDFDSPVLNIDNENGTVAMAQTNVDGRDDPTLAELHLEFVGERGTGTALMVDDSETQLSDTGGNVIPIRTEDGGASTLGCLPGDVSGDGEVTISDATLTQQHIVGNPVDNSFKPDCADLTRDGIVTSADVTLILEEIVGLERTVSVQG